MLIQNLPNDACKLILQPHLIEEPKNAFLLRQVAKAWNDMLDKADFWQNFIIPHMRPSYKYTLQKPHESALKQLIPLLFPSRRLENIGTIEGKLVDVFTDEGNELLCTLQNGSLFLSTPENFSELIELPYHGNQVTGAKFLNGNLLSWSENGTLRLNFSDYFADPIILNGHTQKIRGVSDVKNGQFISWGFDDGKIIVWDFDDLDAPIILQGQPGTVAGASFLSTGEILSWGFGFYLWNSETQKCCILQQPQTGVMDAYELENGDWVTRSMQDKIFLWRRNENRVSFKTLGHARGFIPLANDQLASWQSGHTLTINNLNNAGISTTCQGKDSFFSKIELVHHNELMSIGSEGTIQLWDLNNLSEPKTLTTDNKSIHNIKILNSGQIVTIDPETTKLWI